MGFFGRLTNLGKGYTSLLRNDEDSAARERILERELAVRRPPPKVEAEDEAPALPPDPTPKDDLGLPKERKRSL